jgi:predicted tellurium resistance membrane protein TerC
MPDFQALLCLETWLSLVTLASIEIVLGIDNIVFISIMVSKLPKAEQNSARILGLGLAMITRILLLFFLVAMMRLTRPLFALFGHAFSGRDLILIGGGVFLLAKSTFEIHENLEGPVLHDAPASVAGGYTSVVVQIAILDIVFSLDSVITAIGLARQLWVMVTAIVVAVGFMMVLSGVVISFVERHPTIKMLALSFLLLIGVALVADGLSVHIPRGYIYFAMAFSVFVEMLNMRLRRRQERPPLRLRRLGDDDEGPEGDGRCPGE